LEEGSSSLGGLTFYVGYWEVPNLRSKWVYGGIRMKIGIVAAAVLAVTTILVGSPSVFATSLVHQYILTNGNYHDTFGGPDLVPDGGTLGPDGYTFGIDQGLRLSSALADPSTYGIEMLFKLDNVDGNEGNGFAKLIDTKNRVSDGGWYSYQGHLYFYPEQQGPDVVFANGVYADLLVTRDGTTKEVTGFVDGRPEVAVTDSSDVGVFSGTNNIMTFFEDDFATSGLEASPGTVQRIQIFDGPVNPVPEPSSFLLLGTGMLPLIGKSWKRARPTKLA